MYLLLLFIYFSNIPTLEDAYCDQGLCYRSVNLIRSFEYFKDVGTISVIHAKSSSFNIIICLLWSDIVWLRVITLSFTYCITIADSQPYLSSVIPYLCMRIAIVGSNKMNYYLFSLLSDPTCCCLRASGRPWSWASSQRTWTWRVETRTSEGRLAIAWPGNSTLPAISVNIWHILIFLLFF